MAKKTEPDSGVNHYLPKLTPSGARWARFFGVLISVVVLIWLVLELDTVLTPIAASLAIAYILNPVVTWAEQRGVRRITSIIAIYILGFTLLAFGLVLLGGKAIEQFIDLGQRIPGYLQDLRIWVDRTYPAVMNLVAMTSQPAGSGATSGPSISAPLADFLTERGVPMVRSMISYGFGFLSNATYFLTITILIPMYTFFFLWKFEPMVRAVRDHLPAKYRPVIVRVVTTIDRATAEFFRGRLIICLVVGVLTAVGWMIVGVRYSLPLGLAVGVLNLVPILPLIVLPLALLFAYLPATEMGQPWFGPVVWAMAVFMAVQALENFVLSPWISGKSAGLHPITTVVALLIGGQFAGLLGMLLSIPVASTLKSLGGEFVMPEIRRLARERGPPPTDGSSKGKR